MKWAESLKDGKDSEEEIWTDLRWAREQEAFPWCHHRLQRTNRRAPSRLLAGASRIRHNAETWPEVVPANPWPCRLLAGDLRLILHFHRKLQEEKKILAEEKPEPGGRMREKPPYKNHQVVSVSFFSHFSLSGNEMKRVRWFLLKLCWGKLEGPRSAFFFYK